MISGNESALARLFGLIGRWGWRQVDGESRVIDLQGVGKRSLRKVEFWYDTAGFLSGKADVMLFGMK